MSEIPNKTNKTINNNNNPSNNLIINLSKIKLNRTEKNILNKGLSFIPTPTTKHLAKEIEIALDKYKNRLYRIYYFSQKNQQSKHSKPLHRTTNWQAPTPDNKNLSLYITKTIEELTLLYNKIIKGEPSETRNVTDKELKTLMRLSRNKTIVIKKADKGNSIVILNRDDYENKVMEHLNDTKSYEIIKETNVVKDLQTNIETFLETIFLHYHINQNTYKYLTPQQNPRTSLFYILPKIHKPLIPGRPIVSSVNSVTENMSEFLTKCFQPLVYKLDSHIKDTKAFLKCILRQKNSNQTKYFVTIDVKSLYTNISHEEGIQACLHFIEKYRNELPSFTPNNTIIRTMLYFVLENNYFQFKDFLYKQLYGTSMGTKMAPPFANLFLGKFEHDFIKNKNNTQNILFYKRFLDDIFILWGGSLRSLKIFLEYINNVHPTIKFTWDYSKKKINFLDTTIYKDKKTNSFKSKLYKKSTHTNSLLHYSSYHPSHTKENIIYTQARRYRTLITDNRILKNELKSLKINLTERGFPLPIIKRNIRKITNLTQKQCLYGSRKKLKNTIIAKQRQPLYGLQKNSRNRTTQKQKQNLPFIIKYYEQLTTLQKVINKHWYIIRNDSLLNKLYPSKPFVVYKRQRNLKDILIRTRHVDNGK